MAKSYKEFHAELAESNLSRVYQHTQERNIGLISAHRGENTHEENVSKTKELSDAIQQNGFGHIVLKGNYPENKGTEHETPRREHSYLVIGKKGDDNGKLKEFLKVHGAKHKQDSIVYKPHDSASATAIGTNNGEWLKKGEEKDVGEWHPSRVGEFHSMLHNKKTFEFAAESVEFEFPLGLFGSLSKELSNK